MKGTPMALTNLHSMLSTISSRIDEQLTGINKRLENLLLQTLPPDVGKDILALLDDMLTLRADITNLKHMTFDPQVDDAALSTFVNALNEVHLSLNRYLGLVLTVERKLNIPQTPA
jgi:hypothetical protein